MSARWPAIWPGIWAPAAMPAHLRRTGTGIFSIEDAITLEELEAAAPEDRDAFPAPGLGGS